MVVFASKKEESRRIYPTALRVLDLNMSIYLEGMLLRPTGIRLKGRVPKMTFMSEFMSIEEVWRR
tara:strand:- start:1710 stop:1904 length:195 start_codon:yes stop_codon:yes gene_type:complete